MEFFLEISVVLVLALAVSVLMRLFKQPLIIGYIITGILTGPYFFNTLTSTETVEIFSKFGIEALLFIVGLSLSPKVVKELGIISLVTGVGQVVFTSVLGYLIGISLSYNNLESAYIAIALTFSSTIIILKLLSDKGDVNKLYGRISIGFLLVQDLIATVLLIVISSSAIAGSGANPIATVALTLTKGIALLFILLAISNYLLPKLQDFIAKSQELLFVFSLAWGVGIGALYHISGLSIEIGALVAGVCLSMTPYAQEIGSRLRPLRDFFIIMFFVLLGHEMVLTNALAMAVPVLVFSVFVLVGNPFIVLILMNLLGYSRRTGFLSGLVVAQISEFSLILIALANRVGHVSDDVVSLVTLVGVITIAGSTYLILYGEKILEYLDKYLKWFEIRKKSTTETEEDENYYEALLFGYHRVGSDFVELFKRLNFKYLVIDFNPEAVKKLTKEGIPFMYGDAEDVEFLSEIPITSAKVAISTIPDFDANKLLIKNIRNTNNGASVIVISSNIEQALELYKEGASYVIMPHYLGAKLAGQLISRNNFDPHSLMQEREAHIEYLNSRRSASA